MKTLHVYENKSYDADLISGNNFIHVKSCHIDQANRYGLSWIFGSHDPVIKNPMDNHNFSLLCYTNEYNINLNKIISSVHVNHLFKPTMLGHIDKKAIYFNDIKNS